VKKTVWITLAVAFVVVNALAEAARHFGAVEIAMFYRLTLVLGITVIAAIFTGSIVLVRKLDEERPLSGEVTTSEILRCLRRKKLRCTVDAFAGLKGIEPADIERLLGTRRRSDTAWLVSSASHRPISHQEHELPAELFASPRVITTAEELRQLLLECRS